MSLRLFHTTLTSLFLVLHTLVFVCKLSKVRSTSIPRAWSLLVIPKTSVLIHEVRCICTLLRQLKGRSELKICSDPL